MNPLHLNSSLDYGPARSCTDITIITEMVFGRRRSWTCLLAFPIVFTVAVLWHVNIIQVFPQTELGPPSNHEIHKDISHGIDTDDDPNFVWRKLPVHHPVPSMFPFPSGKPLQLPLIQKVFPAETPQERQIRLNRLAAVKLAFTRCWESYKKFAWTKDELTPMTGSARDTFSGWGATLIDSLDTIWIMGMKSEFELAVEAAVNISFETTSMHEVNVFETNIRYLGGFLSAYDLSGDKRLLRKAKEVGDMLYAAFDTPNRMPITRWNLQEAASGVKQVAHDNVLLAEIGSFSMEFTRLSILTGDPKWFDAAQRITNIFKRQQSSTRLPGMWPIVVNARDGLFNQHNAFTLGAMADSLFEYLPKTYALTGGLLSDYKSMYEKAMKTSMKHNLFRPMIPDDKDMLVSGMVNVQSEKDIDLEPEGQHLACFAGGMLAVGGKLFDNPEHLDKGEKLVDGCIWTYQALAHGIMPESFHMLPCPTEGTCKWDEEAWKKEILRKHDKGTAAIEEADAIISDERLPQGFTKIGDTRYILRPEAIESVFVLYRITGRKDLLDSAWAMFQAIIKSTQTEIANAALSDITVTDEMPPKSDSMESFWMGETLKYFYLIFSEPGVISLDEYVFNTEAHPLKILVR